MTLREAVLSYAVGVLGWAAAAVWVGAVDPPKGKPRAAWFIAVALSCLLWPLAMVLAVTIAAPRRR